MHITLEKLEFEFAEVELTLKHIESGAVFQHHKTVQLPHFFYKLKANKEDPNNEIRRAGEWKGQIVAKTPDGKNTARQFSFRIVDHLLKGEEVPETINHEILTAEEYNAIEEKDPKTLYIVVIEEEGT